MKRKLLIALLAIGAAISGAFGLSACSGGNSTDAEKDNQIYSVYQTYVAYAESNGQTALSYEDWLKSIKGEKGDDGQTPAIGYNGNWWIGTTDTGVKALGEKGDNGDNGDDGQTPFIGENGNWWIGKNDTGVNAIGQKGDKGEKGDDGDKGDKGDDGVGIQSVTVTNGELIITGTNGEILYQGSISPCVHTYGEPVDLISTCTAHIVTKSCTKCGNMQVYTATPIAHTLGDWTCDNTNHWRICSVCQTEVDKGVHAVNEKNVCTDCGYVKDSTDGLQYTLYNGYYTVSGIGTATDTDIVIPAYYQGLPVKEIGERAFNGCSALTSITIPYGVTSIGDNAFSSCSALTSITIPDGVTSIGERAFYSCRVLTSIAIPDSVISIGAAAFNGCRGLTSITIPASVTSIGIDAFYYCSALTGITIPDSVTSIGERAFSGCSGLKSITVANGNTHYHSADNCLIETASKTLIAGCKNSVIPTDGSVTSIGNYAFNGCKELTSITIPDNVTSIGKEAFLGCSALTSITIPKSIMSIGEYAFNSCSGLESITVENGNTNYKSAGNCLIETASKTLVRGCKNSIIPTDGSVTSIGNYAFNSCEDLTSITIPDGVTSIGDFAFLYCSSLIRITIPYSVTIIGHNAFGRCSCLADITYNGNRTQWQEISKDNYYDSSTGDFTIHCTDGDLSQYDL